jgi:hypothetical protein
VPLPTPTRGRRMPALKSPEGRRGQPARQYPSTTLTHLTRGRVISAAFLFAQTHPGAGTQRIPPHAFAPRTSILNAASLCAFPLKNYAKSGARAS